MHDLHTVSMNLNDVDQLLVHNMNEEKLSEETAKLLKDLLFPDSSYVKKNLKPKNKKKCTYAEGSFNYATFYIFRYGYS